MHEPLPCGMTVGQEPTCTVSDRVPDGWDAFVRRAEGSTFCHLGGWLDIFRDVLRLEPVVLTAHRDGELEGILPLVRMPRLLRGTALVSVPYLNYGGPIGRPAARHLLIERAVEEARRRGDHHLEIRARNETGSGLPGGRPKVTVLLDLPAEPRELFEDHLRSKVRSQIRRPMKEGMEVRFGPGELDAFYDVFAENMRDLGTPVLPRALFTAVLDAFPDLVRFGAVYHEGAPVAAGCGFRWRDEFEMTWASSLRRFNRLAPNMLLYWSFMESCIEEGLERFNFGRCTPGSGTHRFKSQWGTEDEPLSWLQWPERGSPRDEPDGLLGIAAGLWRRLPLGVANRLGPSAARRLPAF